MYHNVTLEERAVLVALKEPFRRAHMLSCRRLGLTVVLVGNLGGISDPIAQIVADIGA